ncbi:MAG: TonB-dependent receptor [Pseudomonadales bacterium]|jgi:outer membrane receptor protein involved in Fe transport|nr:TonB-dependent receptor [Pseudomonadales bacterium]
MAANASAPALAATDEAGVIEEVVVTGTRIKRAVDEQVKISQIDSERIEIRGYRNIIEGITELPISGVNVTNEGANTQFGDNSAFPNLLNLGTQRTLTLVNGRRFVSSNQATVFVPGNANGVQVDTTIYNPALLETTEVLTVGGGPVYGADAVAGVVNLILKDDYEGLNIVAQGGMTELGDGEEGRFSVLWGKNFMDGRANITVGGEYLETALVRSKPGKNGRRAIDTSAEEFITPPSFASERASVLFPGASDPRFVQGGVLVNAATGAGGSGSPLLNEADRLRGDFFSLDPLALIGTSSAGRGNALLVDNPNPLTNTDFPTLAVPLRFLPNGGLAPFSFGDVQNFPAERGATIGGDGFLDATNQNIRSGQQRASFNLLGRYDLTDSITLKQEFVYAEIRNESAEGALSNSAYGSNTAGSRAIPIFIDQNPLFAQNVAAIDGLVAQGLEVDDIGGERVLYQSRELSDVTGFFESGNESTTFRSVTSVEGDFVFADRDFNWDVAFIYGRNESDNFDTNLLDIEFALATDVVADAAGNPVCYQQTLAAPESIAIRNPSLAFINTGVSLTPTQAQVDSCQPLNLFGYGNASPEARNYVTANVDSNNESEQIVFSGALDGKIIDVPAGEMLFGAQIEYREESNEFTPGPVFGQGLARNTLGQGSEGTLKFLEYGSEFILPVFGPDFNFVGMDEFEFQGAVRWVNRDIESNNIAAQGAEDVTDLSWTAGARWTPVEEWGITIRGNYTEAVRSPSVVELVGAGVTGFTGGGDSDFACDVDNIDGGPNPAVRRANCETAFAALGQSALLDAGLQIPGGTSRPAAGGSNPFLENEKSESFTIGLVWQPDFIPNLTVEADYFEIDLEDQIALSFQVNSCYDSPAFPNTTVGSFPVCDAGLFNVEAGGPFAPNADPALGFVIPEINPLTGRPVPLTARPGTPADQQAPGNLAFVFFPTINVGAEQLRAWSGGINYNFEIGDVLPGTGDYGLLDIDYNMYYLQSRKQAPTGDFNQFSDEIAGERDNPKYSHTMFFTHMLGRFNHQLQWIHSSATVADDNLNEFNQAWDFRFKAVNRFNYSVGYDFTENLSARLIVDNVTDFRRFGTSDLIGFDPLGRRFSLRLDANF